MSYSSRANIQIRKVLVGRGNSAVMSNHAGVRGEITMNTDTKTLHVHDGVQTGGFVLANQTWVQQYVANASLGNVDLSAYGFATQSNLTAFATYANANAAVQANAISNLTANAAVQATALFVINNTLTNQNNAMGALSASIGDLYSNAATQSTAISNINSKMMVVGATTPTGVEGAEWFNTTDGRTYVYTANVWVDANPTVAPAPSFYLGNLTVTGDTIDFTNGNLTIDTNGNLLVNGSLVQGGGGTANTGNITFDNTTIIGNNDTIYFLPNVAEPTQAWTIQNNVFGSNTSALIAPAGDSQHQGQIVFPSGMGMQMGAMAWAGNLGSPFDNSLLVAGLGGNVVVGTQGAGTGGYWNFRVDGNLQLPVANASAVLGDTFGDGGITLQSPEAKYVELGAFDGNAYVWVADHHYYNDSGRINSAVYISTDYNNADHRWAFDSTGTTIVPGPVVVPAGNSALGMIFSTNRGTTVNGKLSVSNDSRMTATAGGGFVVDVGGHDRFVANATAVVLDSALDMVFKSNTAFGVDHVMTFDSDGDLAVPGNIVGTGYDVTITADSADYVFYANANLMLPENATITFANGVNILDTITGVTSINTSVTTSTISDTSGDFSYGALSYDYAVNGVTNSFSIEYSAPLVHGNVDVNVGNVIATNISVSGNLTVDNTLVNRVYLLEAYASETYTLPGSFTEDPCRYSVVSANVNVPSAWFNTSTYTFTPLKAGYWEITAAYDVYRNSEASMAIKKNNTIVASAGSFNAVAQQITKIIYFNGSTDSANIINAGGASLSRNQYEQRSWFQARWVGA